MESEEETPPPPPPPPPPPLCTCSCLCCSGPWRRSLKRKLEGGAGAGADDVGAECVSIARVEIKNEAAALREALSSQQQSIQELCTELEEERNASATAASEAMSMILRLQREKAEAQMEFRQFKRFAEQKMSHDQEEIAALEDLLFKKDQAVHSLSCEIQAYKHRLLSYGYGLAPVPSEPQTPEPPTPFAPSFFDYPPLRCNVVPNAVDEDEEEDDSFGETPRDQIQNIDRRLARMERMPSSHDKGVVGYSPRRPWHMRKLSVDSYGSFLIRGDEFPVPVDRGSDRDDINDRVYTVDAVHVPLEDCTDSPREFAGVSKDGGGNGGGVDEEEIKGLYMRMQALEADRESMRQTIMSMSTDKAQIVLLKEIAQQLCKEVSPPPQKKIVKKSSFSFFRCFSIVSTIKHWVASFVFWRKRSSRIKYTFGFSNSNAGLLLLLEKSTRMRQMRCLTRTLR